MTMQYEMIDNDEALLALVDVLGRKGSALAIDFEEECNLHIYGEHICLVQIFDGERFYIVDTRSRKITARSLEALFFLDNEKLWFECKSDVSLLFREYGIKVRNVVDLRVYALALGFKYGLGKLKEAYLGLSDDGGKKRHQQANWLKRPISEENIEYALDDVKDLFLLRTVLEAEVEKEGLKKKCDSEMRNVAAVSPAKPGWTKICNVKLLSRDERTYLKNIFEAREKLARRFNTPAVNVLEKKEIVRLAKSVPDTEDRLRKELENAPARYRAFLVPEVWKAIEKARREISGENV